MLGPGGDYRRAVGGGYGPVQEARALDTMATACEVVDAAENADAIMEERRRARMTDGSVETAVSADNERFPYAWRLCWASPAFGAIATVTLDRSPSLACPQRMLTEARALATCLRETVSIQYRVFGRGWSEHECARPMETCSPGRRSEDEPVGAQGPAPTDPVEQWRRDTLAAQRARYGGAR
ncbi:MAG TPA: hypothetical protein PLU35_10125 [Phycisphaerales bacterium]|nr:hypothetical protein [Phycisphaerales bacterium]